VLQLCTIYNVFAIEEPKLLWTNDVNTKVKELSIVPNETINLVVRTSNHLYIYDIDGEIIKKEYDVLLSPNFVIFPEGFVFKKFNKLIYYDINGDILTEVALPESLSFFSVLSDGGVFGFSSQTGAGVQVIRIDEYGYVQWRKVLMGPVKGIKSSRDGNTICYTYNTVTYLANSPTGIRCDDSDGNRLWQSEEIESISAFTVSPEGDYVSIGASDSYFYLFNRAGKTVFEKEIRHGEITGVSISDNGEYTAVGTQNGYVLLIDSNGKTLWQEILSNNQVSSISIFPDGRYVAAGTNEGDIYFFDNIEVIQPPTPPTTVPPTTKPPVTTPPPTTLPPEMILFNQEIRNASEIQTELDNHISSIQNEAEGLSLMIQTGKRIGADMSETEERFDTATTLLIEANQSYNIALTQIDNGDLLGAAGSANTAYTKGVSGSEILNEIKPMIYSTISQKLYSDVESAESFANRFGNIGGSEGKIEVARAEIESFGAVFQEGRDYVLAAEHVQRANDLVKGVKTSIFKTIGAVLAGVFFIGYVASKKLSNTKKRSGRPKKADSVAKSGSIQHSHDLSAKAIVVKNLSKGFKNASILENVNFEIEQGKLVAIAGPSGSGKSTLIEGVAGRLTPNEGEIQILDMDTDKDRMKINKLVGFVPQHPELSLDQKVWQNMMNSAIKWEVEKPEEKSEEILKRLDIYKRKDIPAKNLSGGQLKRLSLGMELIREPPILVLDEPTTGLDPTSRDQIITALSKIVFNQKKTCILTTHFMDEAEHCDEVLLVGDKGIIAKGSPTELARRMPGMGKVVEITLEEVKEDIIEKLKEKRGIHTTIKEGRVLKIIMDTPEVIEVSQEINNMGGKIEGARITKAGMKEVFVHYTGTLPEETQ
jgi:ABC-2 type transport system ATP-binding protein